MFDLSWSHIAILVVIALLVLGPKELPNAIRTGAQLLRMGRKLAGEFRSGVDELVREAELDETRQQIKRAMSEGVENTIARTVDPTGELKAAVTADPLTEIGASDSAALESAAPESATESKVIEHEAPPAPAHSLPAPAAETSPSDAPPEPASQPAAVESPGTEEGEASDLKKSASA